MELLERLKRDLPLKRCKNNHQAYISELCPFDCTHSYITQNPRRFRYNSRIKVAKCFGCGKSFKTIKWLDLQLIKLEEIKNTISDNSDSRDAHLDLPF